MTTTDKVINVFDLGRFVIFRTSLHSQYEDVSNQIDGLPKDVKVNYIGVTEPSFNILTSIAYGVASTVNDIIIEGDMLGRINENGLNINIRPIISNFTNVYDIRINNKKKYEGVGANVFDKLIKNEIRDYAIAKFGDVIPELIDVKSTDFTELTELLNKEKVKSARLTKLLDEEKEKFCSELVISNGLRLRLSKIAKSIEGI